MYVDYLGEKISSDQMADEIGQQVDEIIFACACDQE